MRIDLHADTPMLMHWAGYDFCRAHRPYLPAGAWVSHVDLPRMQTARLDAQVFGLVALPGDSDPFGTVNGQIDAVMRSVEKSDGTLVVVKNAAELRAARARGARACFLSIEGVHALRGRIERAEALIRRGVVSFGLAHFHWNEACYPAKGFGRKDHLGLTPFGKDLVAFLGERRVLLDLTHVNRAGFFDAVGMKKGPLFVSHTGVSGAHAHWRNLDDEQLRALADAGGVAGIIFARNFLGGAGVDAVVKHILHTIKIAGEAAPALGSDYDGFIVPVKGLRDITGLDALEAALKKAGLTQRVVDGVMGENALALMARALD